MPLLYTTLAALFVMLASLAGIFTVSKTTNDFVKKHLAYLVTFSIGVFLVTSWSLSNEAYEFLGSPTQLVIYILLGFILVEGFGRILPNTHHHHDTDYDHTHHKVDARRIMLSDSLHNIGDGILLVPVFLIDFKIGIAATIGIFFHEIVQEISEFFILKEAGYSTKKALLLNFIVSSTILIGVFMGFTIISINELVGPIMALSAGSFIYVIARDLIPNTINTLKRKGGAKKHLLALILGILIMIGIGALVPHTHADEHHEDHEETEHHEDEEHSVEHI